MHQKLGHYQVENMLGEGVFASVFRAYDERLNRYVALKILKPIWLSDPNAVDHFKLEARTMASLRHPNVVDVYEDYPQLDVVIPHKKPKNGELTPEQRQENTIISQLRIKIEHIISRLKRFRAVADIYRNHNSHWADKFILIAAGLSNYHLRLA